MSATRTSVLPRAGPLPAHRAQRRRRIGRDHSADRLGILDIAREAAARCRFDRTIGGSTAATIAIGAAKVISSRCVDSAVSSKTPRSWHMGPSLRSAHVGSARAANALLHRPELGDVAPGFGRNGPGHAGMLRNLRRSSASSSGSNSSGPGACQSGRSRHPSSIWSAGHEMRMWK